MYADDLLKQIECVKEIDKLKYGTYCKTKKTSINSPFLFCKFLLNKGFT